MARVPYACHKKATPSGAEDTSSGSRHGPQGGPHRDRIIHPSRPRLGAPAWAVRGVKEDTDIVWWRDSVADVTYLEDVGTEETFAPRLFRLDVVHVDGTTVHVAAGPVRIRFCGDATTTPGEARKLAGALVELAEYPDGAGDRALMPRHAPT